MSLKNKVLKDVRRRVKNQKVNLINQIAREMLTLPFWPRLKLAWRILWKSKSFT